MDHSTWTSSTVEEDHRRAALSSHHGISHHFNLAKFKDAQRSQPGGDELEKALQQQQYTAALQPPPLIASPLKTDLLIQQRLPSGWNTVPSFGGLIMSASVGQPGGRMAAAAHDPYAAVPPGTYTSSPPSASRSLTSEPPERQETGREVEDNSRAAGGSERVSIPRLSIHRIEGQLDDNTTLGALPFLPGRDSRHREQNPEPPDADLPSAPPRADNRSHDPTNTRGCLLLQPVRHVHHSRRHVGVSVSDGDRRECEATADEVTIAQLRKELKDLSRKRRMHQTSQHANDTPKLPTKRSEATPSTFNDAFHDSQLTASEVDHSQLTRLRLEQEIHQRDRQLHTLLDWKESAAAHMRELQGRLDNMAEENAMLKEERMHAIATAQDEVERMAWELQQSTSHNEELTRKHERLEKSLERSQALLREKEAQLTATMLHLQPSCKDASVQCSRVSTPSSPRPSVAALTSPLFATLRPHCPSPAAASPAAVFAATHSLPIDARRTIKPDRLQQKSLRRRQMTPRASQMASLRASCRLMEQQLRVLLDEQQRRNAQHGAAGNEEDVPSARSAASSNDMPPEPVTPPVPIVPMPMPMTAKEKTMDRGRRVCREDIHLPSRMRASTFVVSDADVQPLAMVPRHTTEETTYVEPDLQQYQHEPTSGDDRRHDIRACRRQPPPFTGQMERHTPSACPSNTSAASPLDRYEAQLWLKLQRLDHKSPAIATAATTHHGKHVQAPVPRFMTRERERDKERGGRRGAGVGVMEDMDTGPSSYTHAFERRRMTRQVAGRQVGGWDNGGTSVCGEPLGRLNQLACEQRLRVTTLADKLASIRRARDVRLRATHNK
ncbi:unnamed protein product [Vitrella brassicaformis CCMP3155]|uniref:Uncharacterized protein n=1 Tax=Vitrella brassicaformis (strain CCMP3155) TaxID=1169540 RepID=A0A0G4G1X7_VITBC|nr:unnamed protein product [Vitrella brassicaformis CCMP3155]|eukprot:CEM21965.1 unnamed protein product [Vitrella brassicaformis CCMP3155]